MKKILILISIFLLLLLSSCVKFSIMDSIYIASIGIDYENDKYKAYFYLPGSLDVGSVSDKQESGGYVGTCEVNNPIEIFDYMVLRNNVNVNFRHVTSLVFTKNFIENGKLDDFINYIKESFVLDINFYIFSTVADINEIYSLENPNKESVIISMLLNPNDNIYEYLDAAPVHFLKFCNMYYSDRTLSLPLIDTVKIWKIEEKEASGYFLNGVTLFNKEKVVVCEEDDFKFLKNNERILITFDDFKAIITDYKVDFSFKEKIEVNVSYKFRFVGEKKEDMLKDSISNSIRNVILKYEHQIDFLNIDYENKFSEFKTNKNDMIININSKEK